MTSLAANRLRLLDRGRISPGMKADLLIFDPEKVRDRATFQAPVAYSTGFDWVIVNGEPVIANGNSTSAKPGRALRGQVGRDAVAQTLLKGSREEVPRALEGGVGQLVGADALHVAGSACEQDAVQVGRVEPFRIVVHIAREGVDVGLVLDPDLQLPQGHPGQEGFQFGSDTVEGLHDLACLAQGVPAHGCPGGHHAGLGRRGLAGTQQGAEEGGAGVPCADAFETELHPKPYPVQGAGVAGAREGHKKPERRFSLALRHLTRDSFWDVAQRANQARHASAGCSSQRLPAGLAPVSPRIGSYLKVTETASLQPEGAPAGLRCQY